MAYSVPTPEILKSNRLFYGLTQHEAAELIGVSTTAWSQWERGVRIPHPAFIELFMLKATQLDKSG